MRCTLVLALLCGCGSAPGPLGSDGLTDLVAPEHVDFGRPCVGGRSRRTIRLKSPGGDEAIRLTRIVVLGSAFQRQEPLVTLVPPGRDVSFEVVFRPRGPGVEQGQILIDTTATQKPRVTIDLLGIGREWLGEELELRCGDETTGCTALDFGNRPQGSTTRTIDVANEGCFGLSIFLERARKDDDPSQFAFQVGPSIFLAGGEKGTLRVTYEPVAGVVPQPNRVWVRTLPAIEPQPIDLVVHSR